MNISLDYANPLLSLAQEIESHHQDTNSLESSSLPTASIMGEMIVPTEDTFPRHEGSDPELLSDATSSVSECETNVRESTIEFEWTILDWDL